MQIDFIFLAHVLNGLLMMAMPIALGIYLTRRFHLGWGLWLIGAAGFIFSQVFHIPFNSLVTSLYQSGSIPKLPTGYQLIINSVFLGLSAGVFEECTRFLVMRFWVRDARSWRKGVMLGAGHGGAEAIILGGLVFYGFIQMVAYRNADLSKLLPANQLALAQQQIAAYWSASWYDSLLGALERLFTIPVQICLSVIVMQVFTRKHIYWLGLAILWHAVIDGTAVYLSGTLNSFTWGVYAIEGSIGLISLISIGFIFMLRQPEPPEPETELPIPVEPVVLIPAEIKETPENLDDSRFNA